MHSPTTIKAAITTARHAQAIWQQKSYAERARHITKIRDYIVASSDHLAAEVNRATGKPRIEALTAEVIPCALACAWYAKHAEKILAPKALPVSSILFFNKKTQLLRQPLGVVAIFSPWNYPLAIPFGEVVMGLMAGNAIILKVAEETQEVGRLINTMLEHADLPAGLFQLVEGDGAEISDGLFVGGIDKLFFTGSVRVGKLLMKKASETLTPVCLELGGKDPMLVLGDADLERASNGALWGGFQNAGQTCAAIERVYVHEAIYPQFIALLAQKTAALRQGADNDFSVEVGAIVTQRQHDIIARHVDAALAQGARILARAQVKTSPSDQGIYYPATILVDVTNEMTVMQEETFGPVLGIMKFSSIDEALALANASCYALTASVWTKNTGLGKDIALRLDAGVVTINDHVFTHALSEIPWGGYKHSGIGRTHGHLGLEEMTQVKCVNWDWLASPRNVYWYPYSKRTYESLQAALRFSFARGPLEALRAAAKFVPYYLGKVFSSWRV
jgi:succinate-semialdehyde dehydrogenase/glutarate-semialdehyde dehydrogenase